LPFVVFVSATPTRSTDCHKLAPLKLSNRFRYIRRCRAIHRDALIEQTVQGHAANAAA
jgi:hypothetical protein